MVKKCGLMFLIRQFLWRQIIRGNDIPRVVLFVPKTMTKELISEVQGQILSGHNGTFKTKERLLESYFLAWYGQTDFVIYLSMSQMSNKQ